MSLVNTFITYGKTGNAFWKNKCSTSHLHITAGDIINLLNITNVADKDTEYDTKQTAYTLTIITVSTHWKNHSNFT